jgi:hypothetical protein
MRAEGNFGAQVAGSQSLVPWSGGLTSQKVLITYAPPTGVMVPVWTEVAEMSCTMAQGESVSTGISPELTKGLYYGNVFAYNLSDAEHHERLETLYFNNYEYDLKAFLLARTGSSTVPGNCYDVNGFLMLLHLAQGIEVIGQNVSLTDPVKMFLTNPFCPVGSDSSMDANYIRVPLSVHCHCTVDGLVHDAALAYCHNLDGSSYKNPAWLWHNLNSWQVISGNVAFGQCYREVDFSNDPSQLSPLYGCYVFQPGPAGPVAEVRSADYKYVEAVK